MIRSRSLRMAPDADRLDVPVPRKPKTRKCKVCRTPFVVRNSMVDKWCSLDCAAVLGMKLAAEKKAKDERKAAAADRAQTRAQREALKTLSDHKADTQKVVNAYIRLRDADLPCISCGRHHQGQYHAGHYKSVGAHPALRFNESNIHKQCQPCNTRKGGNALEYRKGLIAKIGIEKVEWLEGPHEAAKFTVDDCKRIAAEHRLKIKQLKNGRAGVSAN